LFQSRVRGHVFSVGPHFPACSYFTSKSSKRLGDEKKLSINILCREPSAQQVKCLTVVHVAVMSLLAEPNILRTICVLVISFVMMRTEIVLEALVDLHFSHLMQLIVLEISRHLVTMKTSDIKFLQVLIYSLYVQVHRCNDLP
jgi:hypothetical protein